MITSEMSEMSDHWLSKGARGHYGRPTRPTQAFNSPQRSQRQESISARATEPKVGSGRSGVAALPMLSAYSFWRAPDAARSRPPPHPVDGQQRQNGRSRPGACAKRTFGLTLADPKKKRTWARWMGPAKVCEGSQQEGGCDGGNRRCGCDRAPMPADEQAGDGCLLGVRWGRGNHGTVRDDWVWIRSKNSPLAPLTGPRPWRRGNRSGTRRPRP